MIDPNSAPDTAHDSTRERAATALRNALAHERVVTRGALQALPNLLGGGEGLLGQDVVARVAGMTGSLAHRLTGQLSDKPDPERERAIAARLAREPDVLAYLQALALEFRVGQRLFRDHALDPVASPTLSEFVGSGEPALSSIVAAVLAAQARFCGYMAAMELPIGELPAELFHAAIACAQSESERPFPADARKSYVEADGRLSLLDQLATALLGQDGHPPDLRRDGLALFLSRIAMKSGHDRADLVLSLSSRDSLAFALVLLAADLQPTEAARQFALICPEARLPGGLWETTAAKARSLLETPAEGAGA